MNLQPSPRPPALAPLASRSKEGGATAAAGTKRDTGVRYADVAGIDPVLSDIQEVLTILLGDNEAYAAMGAHPVRVGGLFGVSPLFSVFVVC